MGKIAAEFSLRHPDVRLEVTTEDRAVDMVEEGFDLVIRVNPAPDANLVGRVFLRDRLVVHWGDVPGPEIALWTLYPSRRLLSARVSAFLDYLKEAFPTGAPDELAAYLEG